MSDKLMYLLFYAFVLLAAIVSTYLQLIPSVYLVAVFGLVIGHGGASLPAIASGVPDTTVTKTSTVASTPSEPSSQNNTAAPASAQVVAK